MKHSDDLQRLLQAAVRAPRQAPEAMSPALANKVLAHWRSGEADDLAPLLALFRRAVLYAAVIMLLSIGWTWLAGAGESASQTALANYAMRIQLPP